ncbi:HCLS1 binding protein 3 [Homo sapiens]|uniref:HCLS1-binding protein 3 n=1 Tax=Homo sapiens TaxID=9606 RepID=B5MC96_HUMAN|nr:HCLS1 binding protein 3 [Homo sapiens]KAI4033692.1 HCLS1 binding protein 3 [Homo sapiens]
MQSPAVLVTSRRLQNAHTGLDLTVPQHQEVRGKMMSGHVEYQILVVTRLAAFKSAKHRPEDVVQFLVSKKYSEIEEFYQKLSSRYAAASLPPLPRKVLFVGESDIRERRAVFNEILRCVSKDAELAGSPELLEFLGTQGSAPCPSGLPGPELGPAAVPQWEHVHSCLCSLEASARLVRQVASLTSLAGWWAEGGLPLRD